MFKIQGYIFISLYFMLGSSRHFK